MRRRYRLTAAVAAGLATHLDLRAEDPPAPDRPAVRWKRPEPLTPADTATPPPNVETVHVVAKQSAEPDAVRPPVLDPAPQPQPRRRSRMIPMLGHYPGGRVTRTLTATTLLSGTEPNYGVVTDRLTVSAPQFSRIGTRISDNESPLPQDRLYGGFNGYVRMPVTRQSSESTLTFRPGTAAFTTYGSGTFPLTATFAGTVPSPSNSNTVTVPVGPPVVIPPPVVVPPVVPPGGTVPVPPRPIPPVVVVPPPVLPPVVPPVSVPNRTAPQTAASQRGTAAQVAAGVPTQSVNDFQVSSATVSLFTVGGEKLFLDGDASLGLRVPIYSIDQSFRATPNAGRLADFQPGVATTARVLSASDLAGSGVGDISVIGKYAFLRDDDSDSVFTGGMILTVPTGKLFGTPGFDGGTQVTPFVGYVCDWDDWYFQGFHSVGVPVGVRGGVTLLGNDVGVGYRFRRPDAEYVREVTPFVEAFATNPVSGGSLNRPLVSFTGGVHLRFGRSAVLTVGVSTPVTGPRPYQVESLVRLNWTF